MIGTLAQLAGEPFNLRPWEIGRLTPWQVRNLYLSRDESGRPRLPVDREPRSPRDEFFLYWLSQLGLMPAQLKERWEREQQKQAQKGGKRGTRAR